MSVCFPSRKRIYQSLDVGWASDNDCWLSHYFLLRLRRFHLRALPAKVAFLRIDALLERFPLAIHAVVTPPNPCLFHQAVKVPRRDFLILICFRRLLLFAMSRYSQAKISTSASAPPLFDRRIDAFANPSLLTINAQGYAGTTSVPAVSFRLVPIGPAT